MICLNSLFKEPNKEDVKKITNNTIESFEPQFMIKVLENLQCSEKDFKKDELFQQQHFHESLIKPKILKNAIQHNQSELENIETIDTTTCRRLGASVELICSRYFGDSPICYKEFKNRVIQNLGGNKTFNSININDLCNSINEAKFSDSKENF